MTKFALFDEGGFPVAFFSPDVHGERMRPVYGDLPEPTEEEPRPIRSVIGEEPNPDCLIPAEAIEISDEQWLDMVQHPGRRRWQDGEVVEHVPPPVLPTAEDVNRERQRRIVAGKVIDGVHVTGRDEDARNLTNLALAAQLRIAGGDTTTLTTYRDGNNVDHELTPPQMLALWQQSAEYVSALYAASWAIKAMDPLPENVADDALWPSNL
jgi:hypothetical protein